MSTQDNSNLALVERKSNDETARKLESQGLSAILSKLFSARGIEDVSEVRAKLSDLLPVSSLKNAPEMGSLLADCVQDQSRVLIISDYDCDGATACSVLIRAFQGAKMNFDYLVPDRMVHGYGLTPSIVEEAAQLRPKPKYIITVDNGISSNLGVERARELGIEVLVTDHHLCPEKLPNARLIVNPQQPGDEFKSKSIAGCGVAFYVATALFHEMQKRKMEATFRPADLLQFVALGTIADIVNLDKNNRILVGGGMDRIRRGDCSQGIKELALVAKREISSLTCDDIGFALGPRINAAGRLAHMRAGIECLTTRDPKVAQEMAAQLHETNEERKEIQKQMAAEAEVLSRRQTGVNDRRSMVVFEPSWHEGVVGIVAGRLKDEYYRPTFVLTEDKEGDIKGSGRSIPGFHLKHALDHINIEHPGVLIRFGGHAMAAGITIHKDKLPEFVAAFEKVCREELTAELLTPKLEHDGPLPVYAFNEQAIHELNREVWGQGFARPLFVDSFQIANSRTMGSDNTHLKMMVKHEGFSYDIVAFGEGDRLDLLPPKVHLSFTPSLNEYKGRVSVQLMASTLLNVPKPVAELANLAAVDDAEAAEPAAESAKPSVASAFRMRR